MIRELSSGDMPLISALMHTTREYSPHTNEWWWQTTNLVVDYCSVVDSPMRIFGRVEDGVLHSFMLVHYSLDVNAWRVVRSVTRSNGGLGIGDEAILLHAQAFGMARGFYQYFAVIPKDDMWVPANHSTQCAVDEIVPAKERPITNLYWSWLFENATTALDMKVVHFWIPASERKRVLSSSP